MNTYMGEKVSVITFGTFHTRPFVGNIVDIIGECIMIRDSKTQKSPFIYLKLQSGIDWYSQCSLAISPETKIIPFTFS